MYWPGGLIFLFYVMEHPKAQKTGPQLKVSSDRLGKARNRTCHPWFTRHMLLPYTTAEGRLFQQLTSLASFKNLRNLCWSLTKANIFGCIYINSIISMCSFCLYFFCRCCGVSLFTQYMLDVPDYFHCKTKGVRM